MTYRLVTTRRDGAVEYLTLNRPEVRNAFDDRLLAEVTHWAEAAAADTAIRAVVLAGAGSVFCAGADLAWMARTVDYGHDENVRDATAAGRMFLALDRLPVPVIGRVHGAALGGGSGLAAVCDIVVAAEDTQFGFTETKLGILPAVIAPYVIAKIGRSAARELFLTGMRFTAHRAREIGLVHRVTPPDRLDAAVQEYLAEVLAGGPEAIAAAKALIQSIWHQSPAEALPATATAIAARRVSPEGQAGLHAFLEKRLPPWRTGG